MNVVARYFCALAHKPYHDFDFAREFGMICQKCDRQWVIRSLTTVGYDRWLQAKFGPEIRNLIRRDKG